MTEQSVDVLNKVKAAANNTIVLFMRISLKPF